jgi:hypothetical protein
MECTAGRSPGDTLARNPHDPFMRRVLPLLLALLPAAAACVPADPGPVPVSAAPAQSGVAAEDLDGFLVSQGYQMVPLRRLATGHFAVDGMAGATTLTLILDTGASHTILDRQRSERFRLALREERSRAAGLGVSDQAVATGVLRQVAVGPIRLDSLAVSVLDLGHVNGALRQMRVPPVDGIMGADMLLRKRAVIDYGTTRLYVRTE